MAKDRLIRFHLVPNMEKVKVTGPKKSNRFVFFSIIVLLLLAVVFVAGYVALEKLELGIVEEKPPEIPPADTTDVPAPDRRTEDPLKGIPDRPVRNIADSLGISGQTDSTGAPLRTGNAARVEDYVLLTRDSWHMLLSSLVEANVNVTKIVSADNNTLYLEAFSESEPVYLEQADIIRHKKGLDDLKLIWSDPSSGKYRWIVTGWLLTGNIAPDDSTKDDSEKPDSALKPVLPFNQGPVRAKVASTAKSNDLEGYDIMSIGRDEFGWGQRYLFQARLSGDFGDLAEALEELADVDYMMNIYSAGIIVTGDDKYLANRKAEATIVFALFNPKPDPEPAPGDSTVTDSTATEKETAQ